MPEAIQNDGGGSAVLRHKRIRFGLAAKLAICLVASTAVCETPQVRAVSAGHEQRVAADRAHGADRRVHAAGQDSARPVVQRRRARVAQGRDRAGRRPPGVRHRRARAPRP